jgi:pyridoxamine 5'-phosphate oxidase
MSSSTCPIYGEALSRFLALFDKAKSESVREPTAVTLATADSRGQPSVRTVLLKGVDARGFVFYTNSTSRKGRDLAVNARAAMLFFWQTLYEQVHVEGTVALVSAEESDAYWASRSRDSQVGAWASQQSATLVSRDALEGRVCELEASFADTQVPRPPHWYGYRIVPERIEFWQGGSHRLHDRQSYEAGATGWTVRNLNP